jgi:sugar phosphate isomerase/epimerase
VPFGEMQSAYVGALADRAAAIGCSLVRVFTSYEADGIAFMTQWRRTVDLLRACCDRAAEAGVSIGLQNHHDIGVDTRAYLELLTEVDRPNLTPMYDCWSPYLRGEDPAGGAARLAGRMRCTTVADYVVLPRWQYRPELVNYQRQPVPAALAVPMGEGELPYAAFFAALRSSGYGGWVSYEMCSPIRGGGSLDNLTAYARAFLRYMERID